MKLTLICTGIIVLFYMLLPNIYARHFSSRVVRQLNQDATKAALTFDDGPDPDYTPQFLDLLKALDIKATFFLIAKKAMRNPELVARMLNEGHEIGLHSFSHYPAWLATPLRTWLDFRRSVKAFQLLGLPVQYYRPPWGTFNLCTQYLSHRQALTTVLWNLDARDWSRRTTVENICRDLENNIKPGSIVVLHDSGGAPGSPAKTLQALSQSLPYLKTRGVEFASLSQDLLWNSKRSQPIWARIIKLFDRLIANHMKWILPGRSSEKLIWMSVYPWSGGSASHPLNLRKGDMVLELHINNQALKPEQLKAGRVLSLLRSELSAISLTLQEDEPFFRVKAVYAQTVFYPWLAREGFLVIPIKSRLRKSCLSLWENLLRSCYSGSKRTAREPRECWISREKLIQRNMDQAV